MWSGRAKVTRVPFPLEITREPRGTKQGARIRTPFGAKTLWGSKLDPDVGLLLAHKSPASTDDLIEPSQLNAPRTRVEGSPGASGSPTTPLIGNDQAIAQGVRLTRRERAAAKRLAGKKPKKPHRGKARSAWVGLAPSSTIWDISYNCIKCGRALTNPNSQRHRVGTDCIKRYGSQARKIANPAYTEWTARKARADVDRIAQQVQFDADYDQAIKAYEQAMTTWRDIRAGRHGMRPGVSTR